MIHNPLDPRYLGAIPAEYTTRKLREWGDVYLGNPVTADAFLRAVSMPETKQRGSGVVRAKVLPKERDRRPIVIRKRFGKEIEDKRECRKRRMLDVDTLVEMLEKSKCSGMTVGETMPIRRFPPGKHEKMLTCLDVEYALYRTPLLAAVLLSGHVARGDTVEVPMPHPSVWREVVGWIYTGRGNGSERVAEVIEYLGGEV